MYNNDIQQGDINLKNTKKILISMRITTTEKEKIDILREKYFINTSILFRKVINDLYEKMERSNE